MNGTLIRWGSDPAAWSLASGTQGTIATNAADALEGDSSFDFTVTSGVTGSEYTYGDFIPVDPRESFTGRISAKLVSGAGPFSAGVIAYDGAKAALGSRYFIASAATLTQGSWSSFSGIISGEGATRTEFPPGTRFIKPAIFVNEGDIGGTRVDAFTINPDEISPCFGVLLDSPALWYNTTGTDWSAIISRTFSVSRKVQVIVDAIGHAANIGPSGMQAQLDMDGTIGWRGNEDVGYAVGSLHYWLIGYWTPVSTRAVFIVTPGVHTVTLSWRHLDNGGTGGNTQWRGVLMTTQFAGCVK